MNGFKRWFAAAATLMLMGAGCAGSGKVEVPTPQLPEADAAVDVYLQGSSNDESAATEESSDAEKMNDTDAELNSYGQVYDSAAF